MFTKMGTSFCGEDYHDITNEEIAMMLLDIRN